MQTWLNHSDQRFNGSLLRRDVKAELPTVELLDRTKYAPIQPKNQLLRPYSISVFPDRQTTVNAPFLKGGKHKRVAEPPTGEGEGRAKTAARPRTPGYGGEAKDPQTCRQPPRSGRLDHESPDHLAELARISHDQDSRGAWMPSQDRAHPPPPLQRRRDRWSRRPFWSRTQASHHGRRALQDHRSGLQGAVRKASPLRWPTTGGSRRDQGRLLDPGCAGRGRPGDRHRDQP
jgi:hypothetical protein